MRPLFFKASYGAVSVTSGRSASETAYGRLSLKSIVESSGPAYRVLRALLSPTYVLMLVTLTAVLPEAIIDSRLVKSGRTPIFSNLFPFALSAPVRGWS